MYIYEYKYHEDKIRLISEYIFNFMIPTSSCLRLISSHMGQGGMRHLRHLPYGPYLYTVIVYSNSIVYCNLIPT